MALAVDDLVTYLAAYTPTLSLTSGTNLFRFALTPEPDEQVVLIPYGGMEPEGAFGSAGVRWDHTRIQVVCRGAKDDHRVPAAKADAIWLALGKVQASTLSGTFYHRAWPLQSPNHMGTDGQGRPLIGFNIDVYRDLGV
jgi:hypothetical protein